MVEERVNRKLAAILAADVVGYSRLMGAGEAGTLAALKRHREAVFDPAVAAHNGRVVKLIGDGVIAEFGSVVDAVSCALSVQRAGAPSPDATARQPTIVLRIGINLGDVIFEKDDLYGDGVNIAARLEPGGICVSSIVNESVGNRVDVRFTDGGDISVKNIDRPIRVWKWHPGKTDVAPNRSTTANAEPQVETQSIAVLPFTNMSGAPEQEYFSDGISEDVITDLSKIAGLMVISRNSSFTYKGRSIDIRDIGRDLGVRSVLEGSIRRAGNRVRITAQLIDATNGAHLWADRYDRDLTDIFAVRMAYNLDYQNRWSDDPDNSLQLAKHNAEQAIEKDPNEPFARLVASWSAMFEKDLDRAKSEANIALSLNPNFSGAYASLGSIHTYSGRPLEAIEALERASRLDPAFRPGHLHFLGMSYLLAGKYENSGGFAQGAHPPGPRDGF